MLRVANTTRNNIVAVLGEFVGTFLFLLFSFAGTQVANTPPGAPDSDPNLPCIIFIALAFGVSLTANVWAFYRITGGMFNPVVTLALVVCGGFSPLRALLIMPTQIIAGLCAAGVASALFPGPLAVTTTLGGGANVAQGFFIETFLTTQLVFVILMVAVEKHRSTFLAPVAIGLSFFLAELTGVYFTGGSLNPARSLGPAVVARQFTEYHWIYWLGPIFGSMMACGFYLLLHNLRYHECNPGQEADGQETTSKTPLTSTA
ncbi:MIP family channel protein [Colletotrichum graminicola]|nr:MIP family channel protein [Colletotrichum graminicola]